MTKERNNRLNSFTVEMAIIIPVIVITFWVGNENKPELGYWPMWVAIILELFFAIMIYFIRKMTNEITKNESKLSEFYSYFQKSNEISSHLKELTEYEELLKDLTTITKNLIKLKRKPQPLMFAIMKSRLQKEAKVFRQIGGQHNYTRKLKNRKSPVQSIFENFISELSKNDEYLTVSNLDFWATETLSHKMQFVDANVAAAKKGVKIKRIIIIDGTKDDISDEDKVFLNKLNDAITNSDPNSYLNNIETKICLLEESDQRKLIEIGTFAICRNSMGNEKFENVLIQAVFSNETYQSGKKAFEEVNIIVDVQNVEHEIARFERWFWQEMHVEKLQDFVNILN